MIFREWLAHVLTLTALAAAPAGPDVVWAPIERADSGSVIKLTGRISGGEGATRVESARVAGRIVRIIRREGEAVPVGAPLFEISSADCTSLAEEKKVAEARGLSDLVQAAASRSQQLGLRLEPNRCLAMATHSGTIVKRSVELGAAFNAGDPLLTLLDTRHLIVELDVPERLSTRMQEGQSARFTLAAVPDQSFSTTIERVLPMMDAQTRTAKVRLREVKLPPRTSLDSLVFAEVLGPAEDGLLRVPITAFVFHQNRQYLVKEGNPHPVAVPVEVVDETETYGNVRPLEAGKLRAGDRIAIKGAILLFNQLNHDAESGS